MKILITGAAGYIGSHTLKLILETTDAKVVGIDNFYSGSKEAIESLKKIRDFDFVECDLCDSAKLRELFKRYKFDAIIHFAAYIEVFESMQNPIKYYQNNTANALNLIALAREFKVNKFVFSSTAATYGEPKDGVVSEESLQNPINPYGKSKLMVEWALKDEGRADESFRYAILRYFNVAGASSDGLLGQNYPNATHLIKVVCQTILGKREKMSIFGDDYPTKDGTCIRDYIHIEDLALAHINALRYIDKNHSEVFNVGYGNGFSVKEVIDRAKAVSGVDFKVEIAKRRDGDPAVLVSKVDKLINLTGWKPQKNDLSIIIKSSLEWEKRL